MRHYKIDMTVDEN